MFPSSEELETYFVVCICMCVGERAEMFIAETLYFTIIFGFMDPIPNIPDWGQGGFPTYLQAVPRLL